MAMVILEDDEKKSHHDRHGRDASEMWIKADLRKRHRSHGPVEIVDSPSTNGDVPSFCMFC